MQSKLDFITTAPGFQYSINLEQDLSDVNKIKNYIPCESRLKIINELIGATVDKNKKRASILTGAYGTGKSHMLLFIINALYNRDKSVFTDVMKKIKSNEAYKETYDLLNTSINSDRKLLPVIISGSSLNIKRAMLIGLKNALKFANIENLMPATYFNAAANVIELSWKNEYKNTYKKFSQMINVDVKTFVRELKAFNQDIYNEFEAIYPQLTSGSEFNPLNGIDIIELYVETIKAIKDYGYKGIYIIYDEFSKFLEGSIDRNSAMEIKLLQDIAEYTDRCKDIYITLVSHKSIGSYVDKLPKEKVDSWKAVENRFRHIEVQYNANENYELISNVIIKSNPKWNEFFDKNSKYFKDMLENTLGNDIFSWTSQQIDNVIVQGTYPLHPVSTYILPRISEKVAQNERSIFTFLSVDEKNTLNDFINNSNKRFPVLTPEYIFTYFERLFKKERKNSDIYMVWRDTISALNKVSEDDELAIRIIKTLGLIYIVDEFYKLPPTEEIIKFIFNNDIDIEKKIEELKENKIFYYIKSKKYLKFLEASDIDIDLLIESRVQARKHLSNVKELLNKHFNDHYIYANGYNDEKEIIRYFDFEFINYDEVLNICDWNKKIDDKISDGTVYGVIFNDDTDLTQAIERIKQINNDRILFVIPKKSVKLQELLERYDALIDLIVQEKAKENKDTLLIEELNVYFEDLQCLLIDYINVYFKPELRKAYYIYNGEARKINRSSELNRLVSQICTDVYMNTPIIINEQINKNEITSTAASSRKKVLDALLKNELAQRLGLTGHGPDVNIMQACLVVKGILRETETGTIINTGNLEDQAMQLVMNEINNFLLSTANGEAKEFSVLYDILSKANNHLGLKKGVIPIYIAAGLRRHKQHTVVVHKGVEMELTGQLLEDINKRPSEYNVILEGWNQEKEQYIIGLEDLFKDYLIPSEKELNAFEYIVKAMKRWHMQLPTYAKEAKCIYLSKDKITKLDTKIIKYRNSLKAPRINARDYLFSKLNSIFSDNNEEIASINKISKTKTTLDKITDNLIDVLIKEVKSIFSSKNNNESLYSVLKDWYEGIDNETKIHKFNLGEDLFLNLILNISHNDKDSLEKIAKIVTGLRIDDWDDSKIGVFLEGIELLKKNIEDYNVSIKVKGSNSSNKESYRIASLKNGEKAKEITIDKVEISPRGQMVISEMKTMLDEYGDAISKNEKRRILMEILEIYC